MLAQRTAGSYAVRFLGFGLPRLPSADSRCVIQQLDLTRLMHVTGSSGNPDAVSNRCGHMGSFGNPEATRAFAPGQPPGNPERQPNLGDTPVSLRVMGAEAALDHPVLPFPRR